MKTTLCFTLTILLLGTAAQATELKLASIFSDHAVLQRDQPAPLWGWADAGTKVSVEFAGQTKTTTADAAGKWMVKLDAMAAEAKPREITVSASNAKSEIQMLKRIDVLVGEVWLASGQSNMGVSLSGAHNAATEIPKAEDPLLRFFNVKAQTAGNPLPDVHGQWAVSSPKTAPGFSAVAYFFARELRTKLDVPVAMIQAAWGGTPAQAWTSIDALGEEPPLTRHLEAWEKALTKKRELDANPQIAADYADKIKRWNTEVRPTFDAAMKAYNAAKDAGNNQGTKPEAAWPEPANPDPMGMPSPSARPGTPSVIFNGMIAPLAPYALRGAIWYQGEANGGAGLEYRTLLPRLISDWRKHWSADFPFLFVQLPGWDHDTKPAETHDWPWLREAQLFTLKSVPLTAMAVTIDVGNPANVHPSDKLDVGLRLALAARKLAYKENIVASGPLYQGFTVEGVAARVKFSEVGGGLAPGQAPWRADKVEPLPLDKLIGFTIAGEDKKWHEADAKIDGDSIIVSSPDVLKPAAVRYGWANSPRCNLYNKDGLPASPFRSDDWK
ncbi:sialate O-acetylesterase [soil metagenome]